MRTPAGLSISCGLVACIFLSSCDNYDWCTLYRGDVPAAGSLTITESFGGGSTTTHVFERVYLDLVSANSFRVRACSVGSGQIWRADLWVDNASFGTEEAVELSRVPLSGVASMVADVHYCDGDSCSVRTRTFVSGASSGVGTLDTNADASSVSFDIPGNNGVGWTFDLSAQLSR